MEPSPSHTMSTAAIHAGELHDAVGAHIPPIYQTSTYSFEDMAAIEARNAGEVDSYIYSRGGNPTRRALADKIAALESWGDGNPPGSAVAEIFSSGMAAVAAALMALAHAGDHVIAQRTLYGSSDHLISEVLPRYGITTSRVPLLEATALDRELEQHPNTAAVYLETPANPTLAVIDIARTAAIAHDHGARVVVDNTFATPILQRPLSLGADLVVHSTTKYINGHGTVIGGAVVGTDEALMEEVTSLIRFTGGVPGAFDCWLTNLGLKTLPLRMERHVANAMSVAGFLHTHPAVVATHYPGLQSHPGHEIASRQMDGFGAMLAFDLGSYEAATRFLDRLEVCTLAVSLGNVDTLVEHPASMTHRMVDPQARASSGITDGLVRMSVGLEAVEDILGDLDGALDA